MTFGRGPHEGCLSAMLGGVDSRAVIKQRLDWSGFSRARGGVKGGFVARQRGVGVGAGLE